MKYHIANNKAKLKYTNSTFSKIVSGVFLLFFLWGILDALFRGDSVSTLIVPIILLILALVGVLFTDKWEIDKSDLSIKYKFGVYPFISITGYKVEDIRKISITHFVKGSFDENAEYKRKGRAFRAQVRFSLILKNDDSVDVEIIDEKKSGGTCERAALLFSTLLGLPLTKDRERDLDLDVGLRDINKFKN